MRIARRQATALGLRTVQRGAELELRDATGRVFAGGLTALETYLREAHQARQPGPDRSQMPASWREMTSAYLLHLAAAGHTARTIDARRKSLTRIARALRCPPGDVTAERLVDWFGRQDWKPETRKFYRSAARGFFAWAYRTGRVPEYLPDALPSVRIPAAVPRPVPDDAWRTALAKADPRVTLMMRLAAEVGMRRAEVARVHTRDVVEGIGGAQLVVHGKGGKTRVVPISDALAEVLRRGAAGHTAGMPASGWLFPTGVGGHIGEHQVGKLVAAALPDGWSMHKLRHRFATRAYRGSRNLRAVQQLLGHASIATTERYTAVDDDEVRAAAMAATAD
ncbi:tyrosine-type recombinase/integrase [Mycolicibacterium baixiangningiae]|uniref:tyrosine-type recombinase/integrase n=1 Tax=Mycolicibacterium baixiangningiae TaxID=2761578 RepID=UPI001E487973|nr:tyrosine-type recombinase/integrase [Mycolicibacterium baixiangningiae]